MIENAGSVYADVEKCVDEVINHVGKEITFGMTMALGKPYQFINALYRRAKKDPEIKLKIITALPLEKPKVHNELEKRFLDPIVDRVFDGVPEFDYMLDFRAGKLPANVETFEFFSNAGSYLNDPKAQQNHIASHYTHACRDAIDLGLNVFGQLIAYKETNDKTMYSMACNPDIGLGVTRKLKQKRANGEKVAIIGEANKNMPFMYGDAVVETDTYDIILQGSKYNYELFGPPKEPVSLIDYMIGINVSTLIKDSGTIQVGIGALSDAIVSGLIMRNYHNKVYQEIIENNGLYTRYQNLLDKWGDIGVFKKGLYGSTEMFSDVFMQMYKSKILKRKVFDSVHLMKLINEGKLEADNLPEDIIDKLIDIKAIHSKINEEDFNFLKKFGIFKKGIKYKNGLIIDGIKQYSSDMNDENARLEIRSLLGKELIKGKVLHSTFFLGPKSFYQILNEMSEEEIQQFGMSGVEKVNQLYGDEELRALQRKDGRFINTGMIVTLHGAIASDQLEDGRIISGIGGQYNFVAMAHALPDARAILMIKSTKDTGKSLKSNIVFNYGHCSIPKHMKDIIVTEYGIADLRGQPDKEVIARILNITDSRFQDKLLNKAKKAGKIPIDYEIPDEYKNNTPEKIVDLLKPYQEQGFFQPFPFGTDLTKDEIAIGSSLKKLNALLKKAPLKIVKGMLIELFRPIPQSAEIYLKRMNLLTPLSVREKNMRKIVIFALRNNNQI
ncbi:Acetyl-CoA hydrolase [Candidatus Syntrophocurvum alkaliphilum]|uniref:Acetyl-CoA hydrolase n=1 Tax=Candidatus Syntrophocurvum alkaliphilum TaxID=2293317 RepID=A0A6I6DDK8_9FIRM|nr:acetyl-CoA hydrolase/transferase C-terminal domain-containing protein [Candidatus Syntrophocurvum alkaliphilum]QGT99356.1 Acetyl-CoA hydrolase [Candidatus Syntrophocurvum alkaliphilum]